MSFLLFLPKMMMMVSHCSLSVSDLTLFLKLTLPPPQLRLLNPNNAVTRSGNSGSGIACVLFSPRSKQDKILLVDK